MTRVKKTLHEKEAILIQQKAKLDKRLKIIQNKLHEKKIMDINELIFKHKLYEYDLNILDVAFDKLSLELRAKITGAEIVI
ncbi:MAG: hypothetical protein NXI01_00820 [Gammaproteobacteria bacterium]|nr:hypothetical protein [Gammaproteobacteria bacterium]